MNKNHTDSLHQTCRQSIDNQTSHTGKNDCPLCSANQISAFHQDKRRDYWCCAGCGLVFVPQAQHLNAAHEKAEYDKHQNNPQDSGYRRFLSRTFEPLINAPLIKALGSRAVGIDFGCGPNPCISEMAKEMGIKVNNYDPIYFDQPELLQARYDFITMTEVIEHLAEPMPVLQQLNAMLKPGAILAVMTKRVRDRDAFANWHYKNDPTHIGFYSITTFEWIGAKMGWELEVVGDDVVFFTQASFLG